MKGQRPKTDIGINLMENINERINSLESLLDASHYSQQKCTLKKELNDFLQILDIPKTLDIALPEDIRKFLVFKERKGRTHLHKGNCEFKGHVGKRGCDCPLTLAAKSVDSLIGKIEQFFRDAGRSGDWNPVLLTGNPAASHVIKRHLQSVTLEQSAQSVPKKQAVPLMFDKLGKLCRYLTRNISRNNDNV